MFGFLPLNGEYTGDDQCLGEIDERQGTITDEDFKAQLSAERANHLAVLKRLH